MTESGSSPLGKLAEASALVEGAQHQLMIGDSPQVHATINGVHQIASALANLISTLIASVDHQSEPDTELAADLRAMRGCLTTGLQVLTPARPTDQGV